MRDLFLRRVHLMGLLLAPLPAMATGLVVMHGAGVPAGLWVLNLAATSIGILVAGVVWRGRTSFPQGRGLARALVAIGVTLLAVTLIVPGVEGVHRWVGLGPLKIHVGAALLPSLLVFLTGLAWVPALAAATLTLTILVIQPDAAQASSFAAGWCLWMAMTRGRKATLPMAATTILAGAAWLRPDPLEPVLHVEGIVGVAAGLGGHLGGASLGALALLPLPFLLNPDIGLGTMLAIYMTGTLIAPWLGPYPVPVLGYGVSPILGYYLAVAALAIGGGMAGPGPQEG